jgi:hypothetical protein
MMATAVAAFVCSMQDVPRLAFLGHIRGHGAIHLNKEVAISSTTRQGTSRFDRITDSPFTLLIRAKNFLPYVLELILCA